LPWRVTLKFMLKRISKHILIILLIAATFGAAGRALSAGNFSITLQIQALLPPVVSAILLKDQSSGSTDYTNERDVIVEASGVENDPTQMLISESAAFAGASWIAYLNPTTFQLTSGDGSKTVYYKLRNNDGESGVVSDSIVLDTTPPGTPTLISPADNAKINDPTPTFTWTEVADATSGVADYEIVIDSLTYTSTGPSFAPSTDLAEGTYTWKVRAEDNAQNFGDYSTAFTFTLDVTSPEVVKMMTKTLPKGLDPEERTVLSSTVALIFSEEMNKDSVEGAFKITPNVAGSFSWSDEGQKIIFTPDKLLKASTTYTVSVSTAAMDLFGNHLAEKFSQDFTTTSDDKPPKARAAIAGQTIKSGDPINKDSTIEIHITDNLGVDDTTLKIWFDGIELDKNDYKIISQDSGSIVIEYKVKDLTEGKHSLKIEIVDLAGNETVTEYTDLEVSYGPAKVIGPVLVHPTPATSGDTINIAYNLSKDASVAVVIYSLEGMVNKQSFGPGEVGGKAGYNVIEWNGKNMFGEYVGKGIYSVQIVIDGKAAGKGHVVMQ
jgi:hypothetical protein